MSSQQALQDRILKEIIDRIPPREVSAPYVKNGYRYRYIYEHGCEYAIYQRQSALSEEWDVWETLLDANQRAAHNFIRSADLPLRRIIPSWRWQKIIYPSSVWVAFS